MLLYSGIVAGLLAFTTVLDCKYTQCICNNDAQSRYSPIEGKCLTLFWAINKADFFIYGCDKLFIGTDHRPLLAFFRKEDPEPLDHISNKRLRKYEAEIGELRFTMFHIERANNFLADRGNRFPTGSAGNDRGDGATGESDSAKVIGAAGAEIRAQFVHGRLMSYLRMIFHVIPKLHKYLLRVQTPHLRMQRS